MAEDNVGGIAVSFTADAAQLQAEINRLEGQLKTFNANYGSQKVALQITTPSRRALLDTRREISNAFTARGSAGQIMAQVHVASPDARALGTFRNQLKSDIGTIPIKVVGNFEWGQRPPSSITIPVNGGGGGGGQQGGNRPATTGSQPTPLQGQRPARPQAAGGPVTTAGSPVVARTRSRPARSVQVTKEDLAATWTQDDLKSMSTQVLRDEMRGLKGADKALFQAEIDQRDLAAVRAAAGGRPVARGFLTGGPTPRPTPAAKMPQGVSRTVRARPGESLATTLQQTAIQSSVPPAAAVSRARLESLSRQLTAGSRQRGEAWYPEANKALKRLRTAYGLDGRINDAQLSSIGGLFSANAEWPANLRLVAGFFDRMAKGGMANEDFLGIGTFVDPIVKAAQIARMDNPTLRQIAERTDVQSGEQWLANKPGTGKAFGEKTSAFAGALHAGGGAQAEAEARRTFRSLTPMDRWMSRGIHGIENVGPMAHFQGQNVMSAAWKRHGFSSDFAYQAGLWDLIGPANAEAEPFGGAVATPLPAAMRPPPTKASILADRERAAREKAAGRRILERQAVVMPMAAEPRGARGFGMGDDFDPYGRQAARQPQTAFMQGRAMGTVPAMGGMIDIPRQLEEDALGRRQARGLSQAQIEQRRAAGRSSYAKLVAEGRAGPGIRGILPRGFPIHQNPRQPMAADLPWDENGNLMGAAGGSSEYGLSSAAYGLMSEEEARLDAPVAGGKRRPGGKQLPGGFQRKARVSPAEIAETVQYSPNLQAAQEARERFQERQIQTARATSVRSVPTFLAGILSGSLGGVRAAELQKQAAAAVSAHGRAYEALKLAETEENVIAKKRDVEKPGSAAHKFLTGQLDEQRIKVKELTVAEKDLQVQADEMSAAAKKAAGGGLRNLAAGFASNLAAGLAFGVGFTALQGIITGVGQAITPTVSRLTNFSEVAGETSKNLAATVRQAHGLADVGLAQTFEQTGFKGPIAQQLTPDLLQIAQIQAGLSAFKDQAALIQTAFNFNNAGGIPGVTTSTGGGLFGIGAEKGVFETIKESLGTLPLAGRASSGKVVGKGSVLPGEVSSIPELTATQAKTLGVVNQQLALFGVTLRQATDAEVKAGDIAKQKVAIGNIGGAQAAPFAADIAARGLVLQNEQGDLLSGDELKTAILDGLKDMPKSSAKAIIDGMRPQIEAQRALFRLQSNFQRQQQLPAAFALQQAAQPLPAFGAGVTGQEPRTAFGRRIPIPALFRDQFGGQGGGGVAGQFQSSFAALSPMVDETDKRLNQLRADGQRALEALVPHDQIGEFRALNKEITGVGLAISGLQIGVQQEQTNYQVAQYNNQLRIAQRSQTDLLQLTGQMGATQGDNLGLLQRQQIMYERQTQELSLQSNELTLQSNTLSIILAQRQINFQRSLAGFVTPGETPQEIAARAREAELEANFAQKQLDIQKEQLKLSREQQGVATKALPLQFEIQDIGFQRQLTDINAEIALLNQGIQLTVHTAAAEQAIAHLTALENELVKKAGTYVDEGTRVAGAFMEGVAQVKAATVDGMDTVIRQTAVAWNIFIRQGTYAIGALTGGAGIPPPSNTPSFGRNGTPDNTYGGPRRTADAPGYLGSVMGATQITVGEAGPETVAIIRNPRSWTPTAPASGGWGGGGGNITVMVTGNQIGGSEQDQERFAAIIARKVEEIQSRRGSLLGLGEQAMTVDLKWWSGFDFNTADQLKAIWDEVNGTATISASSRAGSGAMRYPGSGDGWTGVFVPATGEFVVAGAVFIEAVTTSGFGCFFAAYEGATQHLTLRPAQTASAPVDLLVYRGTTLLATLDANLAMNQWYHISLCAKIHDSTGYYSVEVDEGNTFAGSATGLDTRNAGTVGQIDRLICGQVLAPGGNPIHRMDDAYFGHVTGGADHSLGDLRSSKFLPTAEGNSSDHTPSSGSDNALMVDDPTVDDDTTYVESGTVNHKDTYVFADIAGASSIYGVKQIVRHRKTDAGMRSLKQVIRSGGTDYEGATVVESDSYQHDWEISLVDPATGVAWTESGFNAAEFGHKVQA